MQISKVWSVMTGKIVTILAFSSHAVLLFVSVVLTSCIAKSDMAFLWKMTRWSHWSCVFFLLFFYEVLSHLDIFCSVLSQTELSDAIAILVAGNDRTQALISQMEDICRTIKVRKNLYSKPQQLWYCVKGLGDILNIHNIFIIFTYCIKQFEPGLPQWLSSYNDGSSDLPFLAISGQIHRLN